VVTVLAVYGMSPPSNCLWSSASALQNRLEALQILGGLPLHCGRHERCRDTRKSFRLAAVAKPHYEAMLRHQLDDLVGVLLRAAKEVGGEREPRTQPQRLGSFPLHRFDVGVPGGGIVRVSNGCG
jgi:hypothetical protein